MKVVFDKCVPRPLRRELPGHEIRLADEMGWGELKNGDLIRAAEAQFDAIITSDQQWKYQQNLERFHENCSRVEGRATLLRRLTNLTQWLRHCLNRSSRQKTGNCVAANELFAGCSAPRAESGAGFGRNPRRRFY